MYRQVKRTVQQYKMLQAGETVLVGVSGGPDSLCLLHMMKELAAEMDFSLHVAHLNHGIRGETAADDASFVREAAAEMGLPCTVHRVDTKEYGKLLKISVQDAARRLRYKFFKETAAAVGAAKVALGHHRDDLVETVILNFLRGTGLNGLAGIRPVRRMEDGLIIVRPLIGLSRQEIEDYCRCCSLHPRIDESNLKALYQRNKVRLELIPYLEQEFNPNLMERVAALAETISLDQDYLNSEAHKALAALAREEGESHISLDREVLLDLPEALQRRVLRLALARLRGGDLRGVEHKHITSLVDLMQGEGYRCCHLPYGLQATCDYDQFCLSRRTASAARRIRPVNLKIPGATVIAETGEVIRAEIASAENLRWPPVSRREGYLDYDRLQKPLTVCSRWSGARFHPLGLSGTKKLKDYLIDEKVPREKRDLLPLVVSGSEIAWVAGLQVAHPFRVTEETKTVLILRLEG